MDLVSTTHDTIITSGIIFPEPADAVLDNDQ